MGKTKLKEVAFSNSLYQTDIIFLVGGAVPDLICYIKERHGESAMYSWGEKFTWTEDADTTDAYQFHVNAPLGHGEKFYVWVHEATPYLLFHEIFHLTGDILFTRGIVYSLESEEAFAYLGGWIFQEAFKLLKRKLK